MASASSFSGSKQTKILSHDQVAPLLAKSVEKMYTACKKQLESYYGPLELVIKGSAVSSLFTQEHSADIDMQARFKFVTLKALNK